MKTTTYKLAVLALAVTLSHAAQAENNITGTGNTTYQVTGTNIYGDKNSVRNDNKNGKDIVAPVNVFGNSNTVQIGNNNKGEGEESTSSDSVFVAGNDNSVGAGSDSLTIGNNNVVTGDSTDSGSVVIGNGSVVSNAKNGVGIGDSTSVKDENSIAIGTGATASNGAVAIGSGSVAERDNTVSVGASGSERQITNVAEGTEGTDAVNVNQLNDKAQETLNSANSYTDNQINDTKNELNTNISNAKNEAISTSNTYTDGKITNTKNELNTNISNAKNEAISTSNTYTDDKYQQGVNYTDNRFDQLSNSSNNRFKQLGDKINRAEKRLNAGIAGVTAITSIPYVAENNFSYGIGLGNYQNGNAVAAGVQFKTSPNTNIRVNMSWDSSSNNALGVGFAGGW